ARHVLLDDLRDGVFHDLRGSAGISRAHGDRGRRDGRIARDGQLRNRERPREHDDDRDYPCEDGAIDKKSCHGSSGLENGCARNHCAGWAAGSGFTGAPGRIFWRLSAMTRSPGFKPALTSHWLPTERATVIG